MSLQAKAEALLAKVDQQQAKDAELDYIEQAIAVIREAEAARTYGRPSVMTPKAVRKFLEAIERGNFIETACHYASLSYRTVKRWCDEGKADETEATPQWYFWQAVQTASAIDEDKAVSRLAKVGAEPRFYMADVIRLSRRHRERWAERTADELRAAQAPSVQVLIGIAPPGTPQNPLPDVSVSPAKVALVERNSEETGAK